MKYIHFAFIITLSSCEVARELPTPARYTITCRYGNGHEYNLQCDEIRFSVTGTSFILAGCKDDKHRGRDFEVALACPIMVVKDNETIKK